MTHKRSTMLAEVVSDRLLEHVLGSSALKLYHILSMQFDSFNNCVKPAVYGPFPRMGRKRSSRMPVNPFREVSTKSSPRYGSP